MSRTRASGQTRKAKNIPECEDVDQEFCKRALSLLTSLYENPSTEEILTFPPSKKVDVPSNEKKLNFNSNIVDLRLRRAQEQQSTQLVALNDSIAQRVEEMANVLRNSTVSLDEIFIPDQADRPEVPRYMSNIQKDQKREALAASRKKKRDPMDMNKIQDEYQERLRQSKIRGTDRLNHRISKVLGSGATISKNTYRSNREDNLDPRKREIENKQTIKERREKQMHFMKPEEYKKLVKPKKFVEKSEEYSENEE